MIGPLSVRKASSNQEPMQNKGQVQNREPVSDLAARIPLGSRIGIAGIVGRGIGSPGQRIGPAEPGLAGGSSRRPPSHRGRLKGHVQHLLLQLLT